VHERGNYKNLPYRQKLEQANVITSKKYIRQMKKFLNTNPVRPAQDKDMEDNLPEYSIYPDSEDIYNKFKKEKNMDPEDISNLNKSDTSDIARGNIEEEFTDDISGRDLDIPGSELDDEQENVGNEDEENNYYSIGGDNHNNLDEDKDEL